MRMSLVVAFFSLVSIALAQNVYVDINAQPGGDGSKKAPFNSIEAAVGYANELPGMAMIRVSPGRYPVSATLLIQKAMILRGSDTMITDAQGIPTGAVPDTEARIVGTQALGANPLLSIGQDGQVISPLIIQALTFEAGPGNGDVLDLNGVQNFSIRECVFVGSTTLPAPTQANGIRTFASSGVIRDSYMSGLVTGAILRGGNSASPANVTFRDNRSVGNSNGGVFLVGTSDGNLVSGNQLNATVRDNDLSANVFLPVSFGIRIGVKGNEDTVNAHLDNGHITALIQGNRLAGNSVGVVVDSAFTYRLVPPAANKICDTRTFTGTLDLRFRDNIVTDSTNFTSLISFTREQTTLGQPASPQSQWQYLHNSIYSIVDRDGIFAAAKLDYPAKDPFTGGPCAADLANEVLDNSLTINRIPQTATP